MVLVPTAGVLWFMTAAVRNERAAVRETLTAAYRTQLVGVRQQLEASWAVKRAALVSVESGRAPAEVFAELVRAGAADSGCPENHARCWCSKGDCVVAKAAAAAAFWAAAKVFRIGILMTGKPPSPLQILRWLKTPVGTQPEAKD